MQLLVSGLNEAGKVPSGIVPSDVFPHSSQSHSLRIYCQLMIPHSIAIEHLWVTYRCRALFRNFKKLKSPAQKMQMFYAFVSPRPRCVIPAGCEMKKRKLKAGRAHG